MMIPTIHLNGTSKANLLDEIEAAYVAIEAAISALRQVTVHGRDYYVQGPNAYPQARDEMDKRLASLYTVQQELQSMYEAIHAQGKQ